jgi:hypothetical protein
MKKGRIHIKNEGGLKNTAGRIMPKLHAKL